MSRRRCYGKAFHVRGPAAEKLLSPKLLCVRGTTHSLRRMIEAEGGQYRQWAECRKLWVGLQRCPSSRRLKKQPRELELNPRLTVALRFHVVSLICAANRLQYSRLSLKIAKWISVVWSPEQQKVAKFSKFWSSFLRLPIRDFGKN